MKKIVGALFLLQIIQGINSLSCIKCDSSQHESCHFLQPTTSATECSGGLPEGTEDQCFIQYEMGLTIRGCLSENSHMMEICESETGNCNTCSEERCNIDQTMRESCAICDSATNPNCATTPAAHIQLCPFVYEYEAGGCYLHKREDGGVERGCMVTATTAFINLCRSGEECKICRGETCNTKVDFQECHVCDSENDSSLTCLSSTGESPTKICKDYGDNCVQIVVSNGKTVRDCYQEVDYNIATFCPGNNCQVCSDSRCNSNTFPPDRLHCHQCNDVEDCHKDMISIGNEAYPCRNYVSDDECYAVPYGNVVYRGCTSDLTQESAICNLAGNSCIKCKEQGCNAEEVELPTEPTVTTQSTTTYEPYVFKCYQCTGDLKSECAYHQPYDNDAPACPNWDPSSISGKCYISVNGGTVQRGCIEDKFCESHTCITCGYRGCNRANRATSHNCVQCDSLPGKLDYQPNCKDNPEKIESTPCSNSEYLEFNETGCYSIRLNDTLQKETVFYTQRTCSLFMRREQRARCEDINDKSCIMCEEDGCNLHDVSFSKRFCPIPQHFIFFLIILYFVNKLM